MRFASTDFQLPELVNPDRKHLKLIKEHLVADYSNLIFYKKEFVLLNDHRTLQPIKEVIKKCNLLIYSVENQLINYATYFSILQVNGIEQKEMDIQLESLRQSSATIYEEWDLYQKQLKKIHVHSYEVA